MSTLPELILKRGRVKAIITRNTNWYETNKDNIRTGEIVHRQEQIKFAYSEFNDLEDNIEILTSDEEEIKKQELERIKFENHYFAIAGIFEEILQSIVNNRTPSGHENSSQISTGVQ